jgi:hypothetical protein
MSPKIGDKVYVRRSILGLSDDAPSPFYSTTVRGKSKRSVSVDMPNGSLSGLVSSSKLYKSFGVLIIRIGDYEEANLLDPLAKSILHYCRMLIPGDDVRLIEIRELKELEFFWKKIHNLYQHVVIVGHGDNHGILFGAEEYPASEIISILEGPKPEKKEFISLGCKTGRAGFGKIFSQAKIVSHFIGPFHSISGSVASLFAQTYLNQRINGSLSAKVAFKHARADLLGAVSFRLWEKGELTAGPK